MPVRLRDELRIIGREAQDRLLRVAIDLRAPLHVAAGSTPGSWRRDLLGGAIVCVMAVPQAMAYAILAGVPPVMGLYSVVIVTLFAGLWGGATHLQCGPSNTLSLMIAALFLVRPVSDDITTLVALTGLVMGLFQIICGVTGIGGLTKFISRTVIVGYTAAMGFLIAFNQIPNLLGTHVTAAGGLLAKIGESVRTIPGADLSSAATALVSLAAIGFGRRYLGRVPAGLLAIMSGGVFAWGLEYFTQGLLHVKLVADIQRIPHGLPALVWPAMRLSTIYDLAGPAIALGLLGCIEASTISRNLAMRTGTKAKPNQDIFGLGLGNFVGAFFGAMPGSGSFTRSEFSLRSGVRTRLGIVFSALLALAVVVTGGRLLEQVPIPALATLIIWVSLQLINVGQIRVALWSTRSDASVFLITFCAAMFLRLDSAIYLGVLVSMALFLQKASTPRLMEFQFDDDGGFRPVSPQSKETLPEVSIIHVEGELFFAAAETIQEDIWRTIDRERTKVVVLRLRNAQNLDATGVMVLEQLIRDLKQMGIHLLISGTSPAIDRVMERSGLVKVIGLENYFPSAGNFLDATRRAVLRANEITGTSSPQVRLFYDKDQEKERASPSS